MSFLVAYRTRPKGTIVTTTNAITTMGISKVDAKIIPKIDSRMIHPTGIVGFSEVVNVLLEEVYYVVPVLVPVD